MKTDRNKLMDLLKCVGENKLTNHHVMVLLALEGPTTAGMVARLCKVSAAGATGILDRMERLGVVRRKASAMDRRSVLVEITSKGREALGRILEAV